MQHMLMASHNDSYIYKTVFGDADSSEDTLSAAIQIQYMQVPGEKMHYDVVSAHNTLNPGDHGQFAVGMLSSSAQQSLATVKSALTKKLKDVRTSQMRLSSRDNNPFFVFKGDIVHDVDAVKDFELPVTAEQHNVHYAIAFPSALDLQGAPFVVVPHQQNYIFRLASDSDMYKDEPRSTILKRLLQHAAQLTADARYYGLPTHEVPILIVDPSKLVPVKARYNEDIQRLARLIRQ